MGLIEVVIEVADSDDALCARTAGAPGAVAYHPAAGAGRERAAVLCRPGVRPEVLRAPAPDASGALGGTVGRLEGAAGVEPVVTRRGRARVRALLADATPGEARDRFDDLGDEVQVLAAVPFDPATQAVLLRDPMPPQEERVLRAAFQLGYYASPRGCRVSDVATHLGASSSPVHRRLKSAERRLLETYARVRAEEEETPHRRAPAPPADPEAAAWEVRVHVEDARLDTGTKPVLAWPDAEGALAHAPGASAAPTELAALADEVRAAVSDAAVARPGVVADGAARLRFLAPAQAGGDGLRARLNAARQAHGWEAARVLGARPLPPPVTADAQVEPTARQGEVLRLAAALGYYRTPRGCGVEQVADTLGVSPSAAHKALVAAENRVITRHLALDP